MRDVALIYVRRSMVRYDEDRASPESQLANCLAVCEQKGWTTEVYEDAEGHRSGRSEKGRLAWQRLKAQLSRPEVVAVVVNSLDRASRSPRDFFVFLDLLQKHDVELVSVHEQFDITTPIGKAFLAILMVVASLESDLASQRVTDSIRHRRAKGVHVGIPPFGYRRVGGHLVASDDAPVVQLLMNLYATGTYSYPQLSAELNRRGFRFRDRYGAKPFSKVSVRSVVENATLYSGRLPVGRQRQGSYSQIFDGDHEPLIGGDLAARVDATRHRRTKGSGHGASRVYLLSGLVYCHDCEARLWGRARRDRGVNTYRHRGRSCLERGGSFEAEDLEGQAVALLYDLALPDQLQERVRELVRERIESEPRNAELLEALEALRARLVRLKEMRLEGEVSRGDYLERKAGITAARAQLEARLGLGSYEPDSALRRVTDLGRLVGEGTPSLRRAVLRSVFERVEVDAESGRIAKVVPRPWFRAVFADIVEAWDAQRAWRDSNPRPTA